MAKPSLPGAGRRRHCFWSPIPHLVLENMHPGEPLPLTPRNQLTMTGSYVLPLATSIGKVSLGVTVTHVDRQLTNSIDDNPTRFAGFDAATVQRYASLSYVPARNLLNLNLNWASVAGLPIDLSAFATSVTYRKYYTFIPGLLPQVTRFEVAFVGEPHMFGMRRRCRFGG